MKRDTNRTRRKNKPEGSRVHERQEKNYMEILTIIMTVTLPETIIWVYLENVEDNSVCAQMFSCAHMHLYVVHTCLKEYFQVLKINKQITSHVFRNDSIPIPF